MQNLDVAVSSERLDQRGILTANAAWTAEIVHRRAKQRVGAGLLEVPQHVDPNVMTTREPFDERQQDRNDALAPAAIDAARHHERNPHAP